MDRAIPIKGNFGKDLFGIQLEVRDVYTRTDLYTVLCARVDHLWC